jgi:excisionase family DNA binding protein
VTRRFVDKHAIAELLGVPPSWVKESARSGAIPCHRFGKYVRFDPDEVLAWADDCAEGGRSARLRRYRESVTSPRTAGTAGGATPKE